MRGKRHKGRGKAQNIKINEDEKTEDEKPNQFSLAVLPIRGQSSRHTAPISSFLEITHFQFLLFF